MIDVGLRQSIGAENRLHDSWRRVRESAGAPGLDGIAVNKFAENLDEHLDDLRNEIARDSYWPGPLRRISIPKACGGYRTLAIPSVRDRVVQTAAAIWLDQRFDHSFSTSSFAYRNHMGARRAADALAKIVSPRSWAVIADIQKFFDNVEHDLIGQDLKAGGVDGGDIALILRWLAAQTVGMGGRFVSVKGLPQGAPLSPVLSNIFLTPFDRAIEQAGLSFVRYADDFVIVANDQGHAAEGLAITESVLTHRKLHLKPGKTDTAPLSKTISFLSFDFDGITRRVSKAKIDEFTVHVTTTLSQATPDMLSEMRRNLYNVVTGWFNYFGGASPEADAQLAMLDELLHDQLKRNATRLGLTKPAIEILVDSVRPRPTVETLPAGYPEQSPIKPIELAEVDSPDSRGMFSKRYQINSQAIAAAQAPSLSARGHLYIPTHGSYVTRYGGVIAVKRKKAVIMEVPIAQLSAVTIEANGVSMSTEAIGALARSRIPVAICNPIGLPLARVVPARAWHTARVMEQQLVTRTGERGVAIAREMITAKILNQRAMLLCWSKYRRRSMEHRLALRSAAAVIESYTKQFQTLPADTNEARTAIFLTEARAAAHYWRAVRLVLPSTGFEHRRPRGKLDIVNAALNYSYWFLRNAVWAAIESTSLTPFIGFLHAGRRHSAALVYDLMEEFRQPIVDRTVFAMFGRGHRLHLGADGRLKLQSRTKIQKSLTKTLERRSDGQPLALGARILIQASALQSAVLRSRPYEAYRMPW